MANPETLAARVRRLDWQGLRDLWRSIRLGDTAEWARGDAFQYLVIRAFELDSREPVQVRYPYRVQLFDEQTIEEIDGAVHMRGLSCLVESKQWRTNVPLAPIDKLRNQLLRRPAGTIGAVFVKEDFTEAAIRLTHFTMPQAVLLWNGPELEKALYDEKIAEYLRRKYQGCVEEGVPDYDIREEISP